MKNNGDIAIVGISCRFPKSPDKETYWDNLLAGKDCVEVIPNDRWDAMEFFSDDITNPRKTNSKWLGALEDIDQFDNEFFSIAPKEASSMDPHQRLLLQESWKCIEDSAISLDELQLKRTSVYVGAVSYDRYQVSHIDAVTGIGSYYFLLANRVSYFLGLKGESFTMDTGCSSSFVALNAAYQSILAGSSDYALVGGVNLHMSPQKYIVWSKSRMLSPTGKCHAFSLDADGYVAGEGVGFILLCPLEKAIESRNHIYGVIKGCAVNHGGHAITLTAPNVQAQEAVITEAWRRAGVKPDTITYIEAHGTGTSLGDPIEINALTRAFRQYTEDNSFCKIGSVKSNIGHLEGCSSMASLIKVLMMMKYRTIPRTIHLDRINPIIDIEDTPFSFAIENTPWIRRNHAPLRAGISSFGIGGTNAHVLVEEYQDLSECYEADDGKHLFILSAKSDTSLRKMIEVWKNNLTNGKLRGSCVKDIAATLMCGREHFRYRIGSVVSDTDDVLKFLNSQYQIYSNEKSDYCMCFTGKTGASVVLEQLYQLPCFARVKNELRRMVGDDQVALSVVENIIEKGFFDKNAVTDVLSELILFKTVQMLGVSIRAVTGNGNGFYTALVAAEMVKIGDVIRILSNDGNESLPRIKYPATIFYDFVNDRQIYPYNVDVKKLESIIHHITLNRSVCEKYIEESKTLYEHQYTYRKFIDEWEPLTQLWGGPCKMIDTVRLPKKVSFQANPSQLILVVMIVSSLMQVKRKWSLREKRLFENDDFYWLCDMLVNRVIEKKDFIRIAISDVTSSVYSEIASVINAALNTQRIPMDCSRLQADEIELDTSMVHAIYDYRVPNLMSRLVVDGTTILVGNREDGIAVDSLHELFLSFFQQGQEVKWHDIIEKNSFAKTVLPVYCFENRSFWQDQIVCDNKTICLDSKRDTLKTYRPVCEIVKRISAESRHYRRIIVFSTYSEDAISHVVENVFCGAEVTHINTAILRDDPGRVALTLSKHPFADAVLFITPDRNPAAKYDPLAWEDAQEIGVFCLQRLVAHLVSAGYPTRPLSLVCLTFGNFSIGGESFIPMDASIHGLCKSIAKEFRKWSSISCDLPSSWHENEWHEGSFLIGLDRCIADCVNLNAGRENAVRGGVYYEKLLEPSDKIGNVTFFRKNGVYAIIGGCGGVGYLTAQKLAKEYNASIILVGRSECSPEKQKMIAQLNHLGGNAFYWQGDICSISSMENIKKRIMLQYGKISGVIHSALDLSDHLLIHMSNSDFIKGAAPKISGSVNMSLAFSEVVTDFIMYYSSLESYLNLPGQANYVAGCCFQDNFSAYLDRKLSIAVKTINWGFWGETGVASSNNLHERFESIGLLPISNEEGMLALEQVASCTENQLVCLKMTDNLCNLLPVKPEREMKTLEQDAPDRHMAKDSIAEIVASAIADSLGISDDSFDFETDIYDIGIDSINEFEILVLLNQKLHLKLMPTDLISCANVREFVTNIEQLIDEGNS